MRDEEKLTLTEAFEVIHKEFKEHLKNCSVRERYAYYFYAVFIQNENELFSEIEKTGVTEDFEVFVDFNNVGLGYEIEMVVSLFSNEKTFNMEFINEDEMYGYCECLPTDEGYDITHGCCGRGCDWCRPAVRLTVVECLSYSSYKGNEHSIWDMNLIEEDKTRELKKKKRQLEDSIARMELEMEELKMINEAISQLEE